MKTNIKRVLCLVFAMCMLVLSLTACGGGNTDSSQVASDNNSGSSSEEGEIIATKPSGVQGTQWQDFDPYATISESIKGSTVRFATWIDHTKTEGALLLENFEKDTGLKVSIYTVPQSGYVNNIMTKMASGDIPDVFVNNEGAGNFPNTMQIASPINKVSTVNLEEPIWDKTMVDKFTIDGNVYLLNTIGTPWTGAFMTFYSKPLFEENGFKTPEKYYEEGKWTWDNLLKCAKDIKALGTDYTGIALDANIFLASMDTGFIKYDYDTHTFSNNTNDKKLLEGYQWYADAMEENLLDGSINSFKQGKCGLVIEDNYGLKTSGYFRDMNFNDIGFTYLPVMEEGKEGLTYSVCRYYGIVEKAPNADAAGYFIRYWLDPDNYDLGNTYISTKAGQFYFSQTNMPADKKFYNFEQACTALNGENGRVILYEPMKKVNSAGVKTALDSLSPKVDLAVNAANNIIQGKLDADRLNYK